MTNKIKIQMFGNENEIITSSCGCGPAEFGPGVDPTTIEIYKELKAFLENTDVKDKFEMEFIDVSNDDLDKYSKEIQFIHDGYRLPLTFIAGKPAFTGQVDKMRTYLVLKKLSN